MKTVKKTKLWEFHRNFGAALAVSAAGALLAGGCGSNAEGTGETGDVADGTLTEDSGPTEAVDGTGESGQVNEASAGSDAGDTAGGTSLPLRETFFVDGRFLYDGCGEKVVLQSVNEMIVWSPQRDGLPEFVEIARTGANAVRIVW